MCNNAGAEDVWGEQEQRASRDPRMLERHFLSLSSLKQTALYYPVTGVGSLDKIAPEYLAIFVTLSDVAR